MASLRLLCLYWIQNWPNIAVLFFGGAAIGAIGYKFMFRAPEVV